jgi:SEC-C motif-containing protein
MSLTIESEIYFAKINHVERLNQKQLISVQKFRSNDVICSFSKSKVSNEVTYLTVQIEEFKHITLVPKFLQYINHSCDPNAFFDVDSMTLIALKEINIGDEITFFYPSTEWKMVQPFDCFCNSENCLKRIEGAINIPFETLKTYRLSNYISKKSNFCPCGSKDLFLNCCEPLIEGEMGAKTAEQLMRSRYSAFSISAVDYLLTTAHPILRKNQSAKEIENWSKENNWFKLEIVNFTNDKVEFKAYFKDKQNRNQVHHEKSTFIFEEGKWFYLEGEFPN